MIPIDLSGKVALVTGVTDWDSFAFHIAKALNAAGAKVILSCHPRVVGIVESIMTRDMDAKYRVLPFGAGNLKVEKLIACDVGFDSMADVDEKTRTDKRYAKHGDFTIQGMIDAIGKEFGGIDIMIHSIAFSPEIKNLAIDTTRSAWLTALSVSAYSLTALCRAARPYMANRPGGTSVVGLTYLGGERVIPHYGGGMSSAKAALQMEARHLAHNLGKENIRVNVVSPGPWASRAATNIGDIEAMKKYAADRSPLPRPIEAEEVANTVTFLCSPLASAITAQIVYIDCGYHAMGG
jgi:enoyl-[acyl-carrier protein] reductase I